MRLVINLGAAGKAPAIVGLRHFGAYTGSYKPYSGGAFIELSGRKQDSGSEVQISLTLSPSDCETLAAKLAEIVGMQLVGQH